jgi:hypothetical protein
VWHECCAAAIDLLEQSTIGSYVQCVLSTRNVTAPAGVSPWCTLMQGFSLHWDECSGAFEFINTHGAACSLSMLECAALTTSAQLLPVAALCLDSCSEDDGCSVPMLGRLLASSGACESVPSSALNAMVDLPYAPLLGMGYGLLSMYAPWSVPFKFGPKSRLFTRFPVGEYAGALIQCLLLLRAAYFTVRRVSDAQNSTCGFLLFNTLTLYSSVTISFAQIASTLDRIKRGLETNGEGTPAAVAKGAGFLMVFITSIVMFPVLLGALAIVFTSIPALVGFIHVTLVQIIPAGLVVLAALKYDRFKYANFGGERNFGSSAAMLVIAFGLIQMCQGLGVVFWAWYLPDGPGYAAIQNEFFGAFALPPFSWNFNLRFYFDLEFPEILWLKFLRLFSFSLFEFELFGTAVAVQLVTYIATAARSLMAVTESVATGHFAEDAKAVALDVQNPLQPAPNYEKERQEKELKDRKKREAGEKSNKERQERERKERERQERERQERERQERERQERERKIQIKKDKLLSYEHAGTLSPNALVDQTIYVDGEGEGTVVKFKKGNMVLASKHTVRFNGKERNVQLRNGNDGKGKRFHLVETARFVAVYEHQYTNV